MGGIAIRRLRQFHVEAIQLKAIGGEKVLSERHKIKVHRMGFGYVFVSVNEQQLIFA